MTLKPWILTALVSASLVLAGCGKSGGSVDASAVEKSFSSAEPTLKSSADKVVASIKSSDYAGAAAELQKLAANAKLTDEQKKAVTDVLAQVQKAVTDMGSKAAGEAGKAIGDAQKALGK